MYAGPVLIMEAAPALIGSNGSIALLDHFVDSNGTALTAHTMNVGGGWSALDGTYTIQSNKASQATFGTGSVAVADSGLVNVTVNATVNSGPNHSQPGLITHCLDNSNFWIGYLDIQDNLVKILEKASGSFTLRASAAVTLAYGADYLLSLQTSGTTIVFSVGGVVVANYASMATGLGNTKCGFYFDAATSLGTVANFSVTSP